jgi:hypothetical protein
MFHPEPLPENGLHYPLSEIFHSGKNAETLLPGYRKLFCDSISTPEKRSVFSEHIEIVKRKMEWALPKCNFTNLPEYIPMILKKL